MILYLLEYSAVLIGSVLPRFLYSLYLQFHGWHTRKMFNIESYILLLSASRFTFAKKQNTCITIYHVCERKETGSDVRHPRCVSYNGRELRVEYA